MITLIVITAISLLQESTHLSLVVDGSNARVVDERGGRGDRFLDHELLLAV